MAHMVHQTDDVFSTTETPKADSATHQAIVLPKHQHPLEEQSKELDRIFWEIVSAPNQPAQDQEETQDALDALNGEEEEKKGDEEVK